MKRFVKWLASEGFTVETEPNAKSEAGTYDLPFFRADIPELSLITDVTIELAAQASELGGAYGGWEAWVVHDAE